MDKTMIATPPPRLTHRHIVDSIQIGRERMAEAEAALRGNPASSVTRRAAEERARNKNATLLRAMKSGFGHRAFNTIAGCVQKPT